MARNIRKRARQHQRQRMLTHKRRRAGKKAPRVTSAPVKRKFGVQNRGIRSAKQITAKDKWGVPRQLLPTMGAMPNQVNVALAYSHVESVDVGIGVNAIGDVLVMRNSMESPILATPTHQCKEWDFWKVLYTTYHVKKIVIRVQCFMENTLPTPLYYYGILFWDNTGASDPAVGNADIVLESKRYRKKRALFPNLNGGNSGRLSFNQTVYPDRLVNDLESDNYWVTTTLNPPATQLTEHKLRFGNVCPNTGTTQKMNIIVSATYHCSLRGKVGPNID